MNANPNDGDFIDLQETQRQLRDGLARSRQLVRDAQTALTGAPEAVQDDQAGVGVPNPTESAAG